MLITTYVCLQDMFQEEYGLGASRGLMMVLLQNTQSIIIKISNTASIRYARYIPKLLIYTAQCKNN